MLSVSLSVRWLIMMVMDDGDEEDAMRLYNLLKAWMSCHRGVMVFRLVLAPRSEFFSS